MSSWTIGLLAPILVAGRLSAQDRITIREINEVPADNIRKLARSGSRLSENDIRELVVSPFDGDTLDVKAVVLSDPRNSAIAQVVAGNVPRVLFFVRDVAADSMGSDGMGIQVVDDRWQEDGTLDFRVGDVVEMTAVVTEIQNVISLAPLGIEKVGDLESVGLSDKLLDADHSLDVDDLNRTFSNGSLQANWLVMNRIHGSPVCFERATVVRRIVPEPLERVDWALATDGSSRIYTFDASHRFRNDTRATYPPAFNVRDTDFIPPPVDAVVRVCGFVVLQPFNDPDGIGAPLAASVGVMFSLLPFEDTDLGVLELPPAIESVSRPLTVLKSADPFRVSAYVRADTNRSIESATLVYQIGAETASKSMGELPNSRWVATIPATGRDGAFVRYRIEAVDSESAKVVSPEYEYRTFDDGINSVSDIQTTFDGRSGPSPFADMTVDVTISGVIQSHPDLSGQLTLQDDPGLSPWSGIFIDPASAATLRLHTGDRLRLNRVTIGEVEDVTRLTALGIESLERSDTTFGYAEITTVQLRDDQVTESYEGMLVQVNSALTTGDLGDGVWTVTNGHFFDSIHVTSRLSSLPDDALAGWGIRPFVRGIWTERDSDWVLALESEDDFGQVVNVAAERDSGRGLEIPEESSPLLARNYPNPFVGTTRIPYTISAPGPMRIELFDVAGHRVRLLASGLYPGGPGEAVLDATDLAAGPYVIRIKTDSGSDSMLIIRSD